MAAETEAPLKTTAPEVAHAVTPEEVEGVQLGMVLRHEPTGLFYVCVDSSGTEPRLVNTQTLYRPEEWKVVRKAGELLEGWDEL